MRFRSATLAFLLLGCASPAPPGPPERPNIIFIMADDLGYGHLGCYGQEKIRTPNLDRMAREGLRFTQYYAGNPVCAPSRSVLMTGFHSGHTSVRNNPGGTPILDEDVTVAEVLKAAGYATGLFGKWGLGDAETPGPPWRQGFDEFFGYLHQVHCHFYYPYYLWKNDRKVMIPENEGERRAKYSHDLIVDHALDFLRRNKDRTFFQYVAFTIPHTELLVPEDSMREYDFPEPKPYAGKHYASQPRPRAALAGMISRMDRDVGRILGRLRELGIDRKTIVFFTSDNGGQGTDGPDLEFFRANGLLRGAKGTVYEGGIRVPMIVRWPGRVAPGVSDAVWAHWDVLPTLAELAGARPPAGIDGGSAAPALFGGRAALHAPL
ncbi:MAG: arylsulfatase, partial [Actinomycetota bacterium]